MFCIIKSACLSGLTSIEVSVEVSASVGLPQETIIGLPDQVVKESKSRVKSALQLANYDLPAMAYTINLSPIDVQKKSTSLELAIAVGLLTITNQFATTEDYCFLGSLSLNGTIEPIRHILPIIHFYGSSPIFVISEKNIPDIQYLNGIRYKAISHLENLPNLDQLPVKKVKWTPTKKLEHHYSSFDAIIGHNLAKQACALSIAGNHPMLFIGSPGIGKTLLIDHMKTLQLPLSNNAAIENCCIDSLLKNDYKFDSMPPFRSPHHTISYAGMIGGQNPPKPGEITLANHGILFLDELGEYQRSILETLREPLETFKIQISRAGNTIVYPANFLLLAAMNPCYCGQYFNQEKHCTCNPTKIKMYWQRLSKPLLDRFSICLILSKPSVVKPIIAHNELIEMIKTATNIAKDRNPDGCRNQQIPGTSLMNFCSFEPKCLDLIDQFCNKNQLSLRARTRIIRLSLTISDSNGRSKISTSDVSLAIQLSQHSQLP